MTQPNFAERLESLLQSTVLKICQEVVPFSDSISVSGKLCIEADSHEVCTVSLKSRQGGGPRDAPEQNTMKTPSPRAGELATMKGLTGSRQSLVDTLVAEAMKVWYNEGPSPERARVQEIRAEYAQDARKSIAVELGVEAMSKYGQISPETLEAAAQLRRLHDQPLLLPSQPPPPPVQQPVPLAPPEPPAREKHARKQKLVANTDYDTPRKAGCHKPSRTEQQQTPMKNARGMYECDACGKEFTFGTNLTRHQRNFHGRPFKRKKNNPRQLKAEFNGNSNDSEMEETEDHIENNANLANTPKVLDENRNFHLSQDQADVSAGDAPVSCDSSTFRNESFQQPPLPVSSSSDANPESTSTSGTYTSGSKYIYVSASDSRSDPQFACVLCNRKFSHLRNLGRHLKVMHSVSLVDIEMEECRLQKEGQIQGCGGHKCKWCGESFSFVNNLYRHMTNVHKGRKRERATKKGLAPANNAAPRAKDLACDMCHMRFTQQSNLTRHIRKVHKMVRVPVADSDSPEGPPPEPQAPPTDSAPSLPQETLQPPALPPVAPPPQVSSSLFSTSQMPLPQPLGSPMLHPPPFNPFMTGASPSSLTLPQSPSAQPFSIPPPSGGYSPLLTPLTPDFNNLNFPSRPLTQRPQAPPLPYTQDLSPISSSDISPTNTSAHSTSSDSLQPMISSENDASPPANANSDLSQPFLNQPTMTPDQPTVDPSGAKGKKDASKRSVSCPVCAMKFSYRTNLVRHMRTVHKCRSPNSSDSSSVAASKASSKCQPLKPVPSSSTATPLKVPMVTPSAPSPSKQKAQKKTVSALASARHRHICPVCNWSFTFRTNYTRHMRKQHNMVPEGISESGGLPSTAVST